MGTMETQPIEFAFFNALQAPSPITPLPFVSVFAPENLNIILAIP